MKNKKEHYIKPKVAIKSIKFNLLFSFPGESDVGGGYLLAACSPPPAGCGTCDSASPCVCLDSNWGC